MTLPLQSDENLFDVACDVVIRLKGHDSYKRQSGALKALARRAPGFTQEQYRDVLNFLISVYDQAVKSVTLHRVERPEKTSRFAEMEDIDSKACMADLEFIEPGLATEQKWEILNWVIFWYYLK